MQILQIDPKTKRGESNGCCGFIVNRVPGRPGVKLQRSVMNEGAVIKCRGLSKVRHGLTHLYHYCVFVYLYFVYLCIRIHVYTCICATYVI